MSKILLVFIFVFCNQTNYAQRGFLLIKKNNRTVESYITSANIEFVHRFGYTVRGILAHIKTDSFSVLQYQIQKKSTNMGFIYFDTIYQGYTYFAITDIAYMWRKKQKGKFVHLLSGASMLASTGLASVTIVNGIKYKDDFKTIVKNLVIKSGGLLALSFGLEKLYPKSYYFHKKFSIALMQF